MSDEETCWCLQKTMMTCPKLISIYCPSFATGWCKIGSRIFIYARLRRGTSKWIENWRIIVLGIFGQLYIIKSPWQRWFPYILWFSLSFCQMQALAIFVRQSSSARSLCSPFIWSWSVIVFRQCFFGHVIYARISRILLFILCHFICQSTEVITVYVVVCKGIFGLFYIN